MPHDDGLLRVWRVSGLFQNADAFASDEQVHTELDRFSEHHGMEGRNFMLKHIAILRSDDLVTDGIKVTRCLWACLSSSGPACLVLASTRIQSSLDPGRSVRRLTRRMMIMHCRRNRVALEGRAHVNRSHRSRWDLVYLRWSEKLQMMPSSKGCSSNMDASTRLQLSDSDCSVKSRSLHFIIVRRFAVIA